MPRITPVRHRIRPFYLLAVLPMLFAGLAAAPVVTAAPLPPPGPLPGSVGPIDPAVLHAQGAFIRPVAIAGITIYVNDDYETATGAVPVDAARGFTPAKIGSSYGPQLPDLGCSDNIPDQAVRDHATFTDAELAQYGLPTEAQLGLPHDEWVGAVRAANHRICGGRVTYSDGHPMHASTLERQQASNADARNMALDTCLNFCGPEADLTTTPPGTNCPGTTVFLCVDRHVNYSTGEVAWMGFGTDRAICQSGSCPPLTEVTSYWHVPTAYYKGFNLDDSLTWVGLGGVHYNGATTGHCANNQTPGSPSLVQIGTRSYHEGGNPAPPIYELWAENCSSNIGGMITFGNIGVGDLVQASVGSTSSATPSALFFEDYTAGLIMSLPNGPGSGWGVTSWPAPDQNTAECVGEEPAHPNPPWAGMTDWGDTLHFEFCRAWTSYSASTIKGLGSMPGDTLLNFRNYVVNGGEAYCASTQWWDSLDPTYGYTSYYLHSVISTTPECVNGPG